MKKTLLSPEKLRKSEHDYPSHRIAMGDWTQRAYQEYLHNPEFKTIVRDLRKENFYLSDLSENYRVINHWDSESILLTKKADSGKWRSFGLLDIEWINTISILRKFNVPLEKIKKSKQTLFHGESALENVPNRIFEFFVVEFLTKGKGRDAYLVVFHDGSADIATKTDYLEHIKRFGMRAHICIPLEQIFAVKSRHVSDEEYLKQRTEKLSIKEREILIAILARDYSTLEVTLKNGEFHMLNKDMKMKVDTDPFNLMAKIMDEEEYQDITLKRENGKVVFVEYKNKKLL